MNELSDTFKHDITERLWTHVQAEVQDALNIEYLDGDIDNIQHAELLKSTLEYLEDNLTIYIK